MLVVRHALDAARDPADLEWELRRVYPRAAVHRTELAGALIETWYVYRDGRWAGDRTGVIDVEDAGATREPIVGQHLEARPDDRPGDTRDGDPPRTYLERRLAEARDRLAGAPPQSVLWFDALSAVRQLELLLAH